jgi:hypothetical protein
VPPRLCVLVIPLSAQNTPPALSLAERRAALEDRQKRHIDTGDGTKIDESRRQESGGVWVTEKKVGSGDKVPYALLTYERGAVLPSPR